MTREPVPLAAAVAEYLAALVDAALVDAALVDAASALTPVQLDRLRALLHAPQAPIPAPRGPHPVTSAGTASHGFSAGARPDPTPTVPQRPTQAPRRALPRPGFRATPEASS